MRYFFLLVIVFFSFKSMAQNNLPIYYSGTNQLRQNITFLDSNSNDKMYLENFFLNGNKKSEGEAINYKPIGVWNYFDSTGVLIESYNHDLQFNFNYANQKILNIDSLIVKNVDMNFLSNFDQTPHFIGGNIELLDFLKKNLRYPIAAKEAKVKGCVVLSMLVNENGNILNPKVIRSIGFGCDDEALRLIGLMGKWVPGKKLEKNIKTTFCLPILFSINE